MFINIVWAFFGLAWCDNESTKANVAHDGKLAHVVDVAWVMIWFRLYVLVLLAIILFCSLVIICFRGCSI